MICELSVSHMLEVRRRFRLASGKLKTARPSGMFCSAQVASRGALFECALTKSASLASAWARSSALKMRRMSADVGGDLELEFLGRNVGLGVLLEVELAALPGA